MSRLRELTEIYERIRNLVNAFPRVASRNEDGVFVLEPFKEGNIAAPNWCRGEQVGKKPSVCVAHNSIQLAKELKTIKAKHQEELSKLQAEVTFIYS